MMQETQKDIDATLSYLWLYKVCERANTMENDLVSSQRKYGPSGSLRLRDMSRVSGTEREREREDRGSMQNP